MKNEYKILFTGGHAATTALATLEEIRSRYGDSWKIFWVGSKNAFEGKSVSSSASTIIPRFGVKFYPITTGRLQRKFSVWTIPALFKIPLGFVQSLQIILKIKPDCIVSFGGFASVPVVVAGFLRRVPIIVHEQTAVAGLANRISGFFADEVTIARASSKQFFPAKKTILVGNPILKAIREITPKKNIGDPPTIYITGGSTGAQSINRVIDEVLMELLKKYKVIHQTGKIDFDYFLRRKKEFPEDLSRRYEVYDFIDPYDLPKIFERADIILGRAGANTVAEIIQIRRPALLIPIPWASNDEQTKNARLAVENGIAVIVKQNDLNGQNLMERLAFVETKWKKMAEWRGEIGDLDGSAARKFVDEISKLLV